MPEHLDVWVVIAGALFNSGILFATVRMHGQKLKEHSVMHKEHYKKSEAHGEKLAELIAWQSARVHRG